MESLLGLLIGGLGSAAGTMAGQAAMGGQTGSGGAPASGGGGSGNTFVTQSISPSAYGAAADIQNKYSQLSQNVLNQYMNPANQTRPDLMSGLQQLLGSGVQGFNQLGQQFGGQTQQLSQPGSMNAQNVQNNLSSLTNSVLGAQGSNQSNALNALGQGFGAATNAYSGVNNGLNSLLSQIQGTNGIGYSQGNVMNQSNQALGGAQSYLQSGIGQAANAYSPYASNLSAQQSAMQNPLMNSGQIGQQFNQAQGQALGGFGQSISPNQNLSTSQMIQNANNVAGGYQPTASLGQNSATQLGALSGSQGADAQQSAIQGILNSPLVQGQINLGTQTINNDAAAKNMLGSGNILRDLQTFGQNTAQTAVQNQMNQLLGQVNAGNTAQQGIGNTMANLNSSTTAANNAAVNQGNVGANLALNANQQGYNQQQGIANTNLQQQQNQLAGLQQQGALSTNLSNIANTGGQNLANLAMTGNQQQYNQLTGMTGQQLQQNQSQQQNLLQGLGMGSSNTNNLAQLLAGQGTATAGQYNTGSTNTANTAQNYLSSLLGLQGQTANQQLAASGLQSQNQNALSSLLQNYASQQTGAAQQQYTNTNQANQDYATNLINLLLSQGGNYANAALGAGQQTNIYSGF